MEKNQLKKRMTNSKGSFYLLAFISILFSVFAFVACSPSGGGSSDSSSSETPATTVSNDDPTLTLDLGNSRSSRIMSTYQDIVSISVGVTRTSDNLASGNFTLADNGTGAWSGSLTGLNINTPYSFDARALDNNSGEIFAGTATQTLNSGANSLSINMLPSNYTVQTDIPKIIRITRPESMFLSDNTTVSVFMQGTTSEILSYDFTPSAGAYNPDNASFTGQTTVNSIYTSPSTLGATNHTITVTNSTGNSVATTYSIDVVDTPTTSATIVFAPSIIGLKATILGNSMIKWTADVVDAGGAPTYSWTFNDAVAAFSGGVATTNPVQMNYTETDFGVLKLTVTGSGSSTTITYNMPQFQFPAQLIFGVKPVIRSETPVKGGNTNDGAANIVMNFSHDMDNQSLVDNTTITLQQVAGSDNTTVIDNITGVVTSIIVDNGSNAGDFQVTFNPDFTLATGNYRVNVAPTVVNIYNEPLSVDNRSWIFTVNGGSTGNFTANWPAGANQISGVTNIDNVSSGNGTFAVLNASGANFQGEVANSDILLLSSGFFGIVNQVVDNNTLNLDGAGGIGDGTTQNMAVQVWDNATTGTVTAINNPTGFSTINGTVTNFTTSGIKAGDLIVAPAYSQNANIAFVLSVDNDTGLTVDNVNDNATPVSMLFADVGLNVVTDGTTGSNGIVTTTVGTDNQTTTIHADTGHPNANLNMSVGDRIFLFNQNTDSAIVTAVDNATAKTITVDRPIGDGFPAAIGFVRLQ